MELGRLIDLVKTVKQAADEAKDESRRSSMVTNKMREELEVLGRQQRDSSRDGTAEKLDLAEKRKLFHSPEFVLKVNPFDLTNINIVTSAVSKEWLTVLAKDVMNGLSNGMAPDHSTSLKSLVRFCVLNQKGVPCTPDRIPHHVHSHPRPVPRVCTQSTTTNTSCSSRTTAKCSTRTSWLRSPAAKTPRQVSPPPPPPSPHNFPHAHVLLLPHFPTTDTLVWSPVSLALVSPDPGLAGDCEAARPCAPNGDLEAHQPQDQGVRR